ncbi:GDP-mannose-dependent alpha-(1-6)-phosphatidylinositol monomannoside mannosyltransferase [Hartmannibacter diazotrophicus]|uniref:GDP-mannose-dependent alpha-(1-6)-phosphatidylinositol monomannoside mannosyltransferase n=1 Tax=Hartmannibacter diazotrophicus TaxID=1482074 RepID=A0A2C9DA23_9HYPH|nr:glycosyltransferase [Hartmannibacter diazotrophicus]SON56988.1 GDP-mannose-dependent alpha-(1-6)-phosphatidylinositol monomannoside mannosyltransferase [Hartmannibacter diazotrophicus]
MTERTGSLLHVMLGKGLGGLEQVFLDYQPILDDFAQGRGGRCHAVVRKGSKADVEADKLWPSHLAIPAYSGWDPLTLGAAKAIVRKHAPAMVICHGNRAYRIFRKVTAKTMTLVAYLHKPSFDVELTRTHYICVADHLGQLALERGIPASRVHVVPNAVPAPTLSAKPFSRSGEPLRLVAAGRLHPKKGFDTLLRALAIVRQQAGSGALVCEIAGEGDERARLEVLIADLKLQDMARLVGWKSDLAPFFAGADLFAFPSLQEGFPLVLLEALGAGLPVVASAIAGTDEIIRDGETGRLVPPSDPQALAGAILELIGDPERAKAMGAAGRQSALDEFGVERHRVRLLNALAAAMDERRDG